MISKLEQVGRFVCLYKHIEGCTHKLLYANTRFGGALSRLPQINNQIDRNIDTETSKLKCCEH